jgi:lipopolysaccharide biosynthesis glycosyltransferase
MVMESEKIACLVYYYGEKYKALGRCAVDSFKKYHPDIEIYEVNDSNIEDYECYKSFPTFGAGMRKYLLAQEIYNSKNLDKIIVLGADTITCGRLNEFIDPKGYDVYTTLDYYDMPFMPARLGDDDKITTVQPPISFAHSVDAAAVVDNNVIYWEEKLVKDMVYLNADVICFASDTFLNATVNMYYRYMMACFDTENLVKQFRFYCIEGDKEKTREQLVKQGIIPQSFLQMAIDEPEKAKMETTLNDHIKAFHYLGEQGVINILNSLSYGDDSYLPFKMKAIEFPYQESQFVYNVRAKGTIGYSTKNLKHFYVKSNKLFNADHKQVKVWHYGAGLGDKNAEEFQALLEPYNTRFSPEVRKFLNEDCACGDFFNE